MTIHERLEEEEEDADVSAELNAAADAAGSAVAAAAVVAAASSVLPLSPPLPPIVGQQQRGSPAAAARVPSPSPSPSPSPQAGSVEGRASSPLAGGSPAAELHPQLSSTAATSLGDMDMGAASKKPLTALAAAKVAATAANNEGLLHAKIALLQMQLERARAGHGGSAPSSTVVIGSEPISVPSSSSFSSSSFLSSSSSSSSSSSPPLVQPQVEQANNSSDASSTVVFVSAEPPAAVSSASSTSSTPAKKVASRRASLSAMPSDFKAKVTFYYNK